MDESIQWGRSKLGCDACGDPRALAGWVVKVGTQDAWHLCTSCASHWQPGWTPQRARVRPAKPEQLTAA